MTPDHVKTFNFTRLKAWWWMDKPFSELAGDCRQTFMALQGKLHVIHESQPLANVGSR